jgi:hypothetical protein
LGNTLQPEDPTTSKPRSWPMTFREPRRATALATARPTYWRETPTRAKPRQIAGCSTPESLSSLFRRRRQCGHGLWQRDRKTERRRRQARGALPHLDLYVAEARRQVAEHRARRMLSSRASEDESNRDINVNRRHKEETPSRPITTSLLETSHSPALSNCAGNRFKTASLCR